jgi:hypothetical protein
VHSSSRALCVMADVANCDVGVSSYVMVKRRITLVCLLQVYCVGMRLRLGMNVKTRLLFAGDSLSRGVLVTLGCMAIKGAWGLERVHTMTCFAL